MRKIFLGIFFLIFTLPYAYSQNDGLSLSVKTDKNSYKSGDNIVLTAELKNNSEAAIKINSLFKPIENKYNQYLIEYVLINEEGRVEDLPSQITIPDKLLPGQSVTDQMTWTLHRRKHRSILGEQIIHVKLASQLSSSDISIKVASKDDEADQGDSGE